MYEMVPADTWRHLEIEVATVARRFNLNETDRGELLAEIRLCMLKALAEKYDRSVGAVATFLNRVIAARLADWKRRRYAEWNARPVKSVAATGCQGSVDDTEFAEEDRWDRGIGYSPTEGDEICETGSATLSGWSRAFRRMDLNAACAELSCFQRKIVIMIAAGYSLEEARGLFGMSLRRFYSEWRRVRSHVRAFFNDGWK